ncbi:MAG: hypothetical protein KTR33_11390 [Gammaproteobacteria bacterium]|nr:hypothetical protein [Gammaproteobacteria bacterium]
MRNTLTGLTLWFTLTSCWSQTQPTDIAQTIPNDTETIAVAAEPAESSGETHQRYRRRYSGPITDSQLSEISGMAVSQRDDQLLWIINDSGNAASLFAIDTRGRLLTTFKTSLQNRDWESLTSLTLNNKPYLLLGDSGDNLGVHKNYRLHLFEEPVLKATRDLPLQPVATTTFTYTDGKHNVEALAWSEPDNKVLLITKRANNAAVYSTRLVTRPGQHPEFNAVREGALANLPQSVSDALISNIAGVEMSQVTGLEIDREGRNAYVLTYRGVYHFQRKKLDEQSHNNIHSWEDWRKTFGRTPRLLTRHTLSQAEALAYVPDSGILYYTSEKLPAPLWRLEPVRRDSAVK